MHFPRSVFINRAALQSQAEDREYFVKTWCCSSSLAADLNSPYIFHTSTSWCTSPLTLTLPPNGLSLSVENLLHFLLLIAKWLLWLLLWAAVIFHFYRIIWRNQLRVVWCQIDGEIHHGNLFYLFFPPFVSLCVSLVLSKYVMKQKRSSSYMSQTNKTRRHSDELQRAQKMAACALELVWPWQLLWSI